VGDRRSSVRVEFENIFATGPTIVPIRVQFIRDLPVRHPDAILIAVDQRLDREIVIAYRRRNPPADTTRFGSRPAPDPD
jgi:hypothetical protein